MLQVPGRAHRPLTQPALQGLPSAQAPPRDPAQHWVQFNHRHWKRESNKNCKENRMLNITMRKSHTTALTQEGQTRPSARLACRQEEWGEQAPQRSDLSAHRRPVRPVPGVGKNSFGEDTGSVG